MMPRRGYHLRGLYVVHNGRTVLLKARTALLKGPIAVLRGERRVTDCLLVKGRMLEERRRYGSKVSIFFFTCVTSTTDVVRTHLVSKKALAVTCPNMIKIIYRFFSREFEVYRTFLACFYSCEPSTGITRGRELYSSDNQRSWWEW